MKQRLRVDPIACKAHGVCAELFPERIRLDDWGYPILDPRTITDDLIDHARRAVAECRERPCTWSLSMSPAPASGHKTRPTTTRFGGAQTA